MAKQVAVRILVDTTVDGLVYKPNQLVAFEGGLAKSLEKEGKVCSSPGAVQYCLSQGAKGVEHVSTEPAPKLEQDEPKS